MSRARMGISGKRALVAALACILLGSIPWAMTLAGSVAMSDIITATDSSVQHASQPTLANRLAAAEEYNAALSCGESRPLPAAVIANDSGTDALGWVEIPSISARLPIYEGTTEANLMAGVGHLEGTSLPIGGESTHCVLLGHSGLVDKSMFDGLDLVKDGDSVTVHMLGRSSTYKVSKKTVVWPDDVPEATIGEGMDELTLITCTPYGVNDHRLVVDCTRSTDLADDPTSTYHHMGTRDLTLIAGLSCATIILLVYNIRQKTLRNREEG